MAVDDSVLASGLTSPAARNVKKARTEESKKKIDRKAEMEKHSAELYALIDQEREKYLSIENLDLLPNDDNESLTAEIKARKQHIAFLKTFETKLVGIVGKRDE